MIQVERPTRCVICGAEEDLRFGVCFGCSDKVEGFGMRGMHFLKDKALEWKYVDEVRIGL